jgi:hypothetical protein
MASISDYPPCSAGYSPIAGQDGKQYCVNAQGYTPSSLAESEAYTAASNKDSALAWAGLAGSVAALLFLPDEWKLLAFPLFYLGPMQHQLIHL